MPALRLGLGLVKQVRPLLSYIKDGLVADWSRWLDASTVTLEDKSPEGNDATLYTGRYISTDGSTDRGIVADCSAAGAGSYYLTGKVRPNAVTTAELTMDGSTDSGLTGLAADVWQDFTTATASVTPSAVQVGYDGSTASAADWSDVKLIDSSDGSTVARWQLTESADGDLGGYPALDSSGNGYHGTHTGCAGGTGETTILQTAGQDWNKDTTTYVGKTILVPERDAMDGFDALGNAIAEPRVNNKQLNLFGDGEYAEIASNHSFQFNGPEYSIEAWVDAPAGNISIRPIISLRPDSGSAEGRYFLFLGALTPNNNINFLVDDGSAVVPSASKNTGNQQFVGVVDSTHVRLYKNGVLQDSVAHDGAWSAYVDDLYIGYDKTSDVYSDTKIGSPKIYNRALTADEVLQNYNAQKHQYGL